LIDAGENALGLLERQPDAGVELRGRLRGLRSLRVGAYRIVYALTDDGRSVRVAAIRHRGVAYGTGPGVTPAGRGAASNIAGSPRPAHVVAPAAAGTSMRGRPHARR
jgi:ParE toxin of type II toxin-antitoxin system, parDE